MSRHSIIVMFFEIYLKSLGDFINIFPTISFCSASFGHLNEAQWDSCKVPLCLNKRSNFTTTVLWGHQSGDLFVHFLVSHRCWFLQLTYWNDGRMVLCAVVVIVSVHRAPLDDCPWSMSLGRWSWVGCQVVSKNSHGITISRLWFQQRLRGLPVKVLFESWIQVCKLDVFFFFSVTFFHPSGGHWIWMSSKSWIYGQHTPWVFWDVLGIIYPKSVDQIPKPKDHVSRTSAIAYAILINDT